MGNSTPIVAFIQLERSSVPLKKYFKLFDKEIEDFTLANTIHQAQYKSPRLPGPHRHSTMTRQAAHTSTFRLFHRPASLHRHDADWASDTLNRQRWRRLRCPLKYWRFHNRKLVSRLIANLTKAALSCHQCPWSGWHSLTARSGSISPFPSTISPDLPAWYSQRHCQSHTADWACHWCQARSHTALAVRRRMLRVLQNRAPERDVIIYQNYLSVSLSVDLFTWNVRVGWKTWSSLHHSPRVSPSPFASSKMSNLLGGTFWPGSCTWCMLASLACPWSCHRARWKWWYHRLATDSPTRDSPSHSRMSSPWT